MDDGGPIEDSVPHVDVQMADEGTPAMTLSSQENTAVLGLPSWNLVVGVPRSLIASSRLTSNSFMLSC